MTRLLAIAVLVASPTFAFAWAEESFGNAPVGRQQGWADGVVEVVNLKSRVYSFWVNGNENFFYAGHAGALNEALRRFAAVRDDERMLILLPGPGQRQSFSKKQVNYDWQLHVPSGIYRAVAKRKHAVMTVQINALRPRDPAERKRIPRWLDELGSDTFATREAARLALEKLGRDAKPFLRAALRNPHPIETRRRMEAILDKTRDFDLSDLEVPKELQLTTPTDLVAIHLNGLENNDPTVQAMAISDLSSLSAYSERVVPAMIKMLHKDRAAYPRQMAAVCLAHIGADARHALPALKEAMKTLPDNYRKIFEDSIQTIENAKVDPAEAKEIARRRAISQEINDFKKGIS